MADHGSGIRLTLSELGDGVVAPRIERARQSLPSVRVANDPESLNTAVFGQVVGIHIADSVLSDGRVDTAKIKPVARLGYMEYAVVEEVFDMPRPSVEQALAGGKSAAE